MAKASGENQLEPTPVERGLVNAIVEHRLEWPFIYLEMKNVTKDDLLADASYCARHKHPSLTNFLKECGEISGLHSSMLHKIKRAGLFYEGCQREFKDDADLKLPEITAERVVSTSAESFILIDRLREKMGRGSESACSQEKQESIIRILLSEVLFSEVFSRKRFNEWFAKLDKSIRGRDEGETEAVIDEILFSLASTNDLEALPQTRKSLQGIAFETTVGSLLGKADWLLHVPGSTVREEGTSRLFGSFKIREAGFGGNLRQAGFAHPSCDFVLIENMTCPLAVHAIETKIGLSQMGMERVAKLFTDLEGMDYFWVVCGSKDDALEAQSGTRGLPSNINGLDDLVDTGVAERLEELGIGVLAINGWELEVLLPAKRLEPGCEARCRVNTSVMQRFLSSSTDASNPVTYTMVSLD